METRVESSRQSNLSVFPPIRAVIFAISEVMLPTEHRTRIIANVILSQRLLSRWVSCPLWTTDSFENTLEK
jgi:hypothetical protein